jgi:hypothetical protein
MQFQEVLAAYEGYLVTPLAVLAVREKAERKDSEGGS